jgi:hypothetical protein
MGQIQMWVVQNHAGNILLPLLVCIAGLITEKLFCLLNSQESIGKDNFYDVLPRVFQVNHETH